MLKGRRLFSTSCHNGAVSTIEVTAVFEWHLPGKVGAGKIINEVKFIKENDR